MSASYPLSLAMAVGLACAGLAPGCSSSEPPAEIKGMTPAEYREKQEQALGSPPTGSAAASAKASRRAR